MQKVVGLPLESVALAHEIGHACKHERDGYADVDRSDQILPCIEVRGLDPVRQHNRCGDRDQVGQEPPERSPDVQSDQRSNHGHRPMQDHHARRHQSTLCNCLDEGIQQEDRQRQRDDPHEPGRPCSQHGEGDGADG